MPTRELDRWHRFILKYAARSPDSIQRNDKLHKNRYVIAMNDFLREAMANGDDWFHAHYSEFKEIRLDLITHVVWRLK